MLHVVRCNRVNSLYVCSHVDGDVSPLLGFILRECFHYPRLFEYYASHLSLLTTMFVEYGHSSNRVIRSDVINSYEHFVSHYIELSKGNYAEKVFAMVEKMLQTDYVDVMKQVLKVMNA